MTNADVLSALSLINTRANAGAEAAKLKLYTGTAPANIDTALSGNTLLATHTMTDPAFAAPVDTAPGGSMTANAIASDTSIDATGTLTFGRITDSNDLDVYQVSLAEIMVGTTAYVAGAISAVTALVITMPEI